MVEDKEKCSAIRIVPLFVEEDFECSFSHLKKLKIHNFLQQWWSTKSSVGPYFRNFSAVFSQRLQNKELNHSRKPLGRSSIAVLAVW